MASLLFITINVCFRKSNGKTEYVYSYNKIIFRSPRSQILDQCLSTYLCFQLSTCQHWLFLSISMKLISRFYLLNVKTTILAVFTRWVWISRIIETWSSPFRARNPSLSRRRHYSYQSRVFLLPLTSWRPGFEVYPTGSGYCTMTCTAVAR